VGKKKKVRVDEGPEVPEWIVTFSDMISLLVTFFVLLMTFSSMEEDDVSKVKGAMRGTPGSFDDILGEDAIKMPVEQLDHTDPIRGLKDKHSRPPEELPDDIADYGTKKQDDQVEMDLSRIGDGLSIEFGEPCYFAPGSAELPPELAQHASELADVLSHYPYMIMVEGFTDNAFKASTRYPDAESLAIARAVAVADVMTGTTDLEPLKILINGPAMERPLGDNETAVGRRLNRRVSIRILSLSRTRSNFLDSERKRLEDEKTKADVKALESR
jgi:chemotaxis protein MotB